MENLFFSWLIKVQGPQFYTFTFLRMVVQKEGILTLSLDTMIVYMTEKKNLLCLNIVQ